MKICPVCRKQYPVDLTFCLEDGAPLVGETQSADPGSAITQIRPTPRGSSSNTFALVLVATLILGGIVVLLAAGLGGYWFYRSTARTTNGSIPSSTKTPNPSAWPTNANNPSPPVVPDARNPTPYPPVNTTPDGKRPVPKQISGGVLNGKATYLPKPPYPPAARAVRASGAVSVQVLVDESGNVVSASAVSGHPLLRAAAVSAARSATFSPTLLAGQAVKVSGVITYNFVP